jgi:hypothetical protein
VVDFHQHEPLDPGARINAASREEVAAWARELGVSPYHLRKVMSRVGPVLTDIYYALGLRPWEIPKAAPVAGGDESP